MKNKKMQSAIISFCVRRGWFFRHPVRPWQGVFVLDFRAFDAVQLCAVRGLIEKNFPEKSIFALAGTNVINVIL